MIYRIEIERETDGRWIAEAPELSGVMAYGRTPREAIIATMTLLFRVLADRIEEEKEPAMTLLFRVLADRIEEEKEPASTLTVTVDSHP